MKKLLSAMLTLCMLATGASAFAAEPGDAYLESSNLVVKHTATNDTFATGTDGWSHRSLGANGVTWKNEVDDNGENGYLTIASNSGTVAGQKTINFLGDNVGKYYRISFKLRMPAKGSFDVYLNYSASSKITMAAQFANQWREYSICTGPTKESMVMGIYKTGATGSFDIDDFKVEVLPFTLDDTAANGLTADISALPVGTYTVPSKVWQNSDTAVSGKVITALYDGDNQLLDYDVADFTTPGAQGQYAKVETEIEVTSALGKNAYIKNFLWDGYSNLMPFCDSNKMYDREMDLHNGGFEIKTKLAGYFGDGWGRRGVGGTAEWSKEAAHSGEYGIMFQGGSGGIVNYQGIRNAFGSAPNANTDFKLKFWAKATGTSPQLKLYILQGENGAASAVSGAVSTDYQVNIGTEWAEYTLTIPKSYYGGFSNNHLFLGTYGAGNTNATTYYVDDVRIIRN